MFLPILILIRRVIFLFIGLVAFGITAAIPIVNLASFLTVPLTITWLNYKWKQIVEKDTKKPWNFSNIAEGLMASIITVIALAIIVIPVGASGATMTNQLGYRLTMIFCILVIVQYGLIGFLEKINPFEKKRKN
ncbi:MAG TPA: hypothetical protein V6D21_03110 [Candidatus Obscuribacterales bacterium]